jgi:hypothetical protein
MCAVMFVPVGPYVRECVHVCEGMNGSRVHRSDAMRSNAASLDRNGTQSYHKTLFFRFDVIYQMLLARTWDINSEGRAKDTSRPTSVVKYLNT